MSVKIEQVYAREILNSRGKPTVEVEMTCTNGLTVAASVPSGTSTGKYEALEIYDGGSRYHGKGTRKAVENVNQILAPAVIGMDVTDQRKIDRRLIELDGTKQKSRLGGNAILGVSLVAARAGALALGLPLYRYLGGLSATRLPNVMSTVISGGAFSPSGLEFEDYLYVLDGFSSFHDQVEAISDMRALLQKRCAEKYGVIAEDGGALAPPMSSTEEAFETMLSVARQVGCEKHVFLGLDVAANELFDAQKSCYNMKSSCMEAERLIEYYQQLCRNYPLLYIEDAFHEDDWLHFSQLTSLLPEKQIVGDDLFATNDGRLKMGIEKKAANTLLLKVNQIGTVSEALKTAAMAKNAAQLAGIDAAVQALPKGYDTVCMEGMFSQGEWQLLSIARAAAADPAVLLLDEITANLDAETEARVLEALRRASAGRTVLSVSHRIYENLGGRTIEVRAQA